MSFLGPEMLVFVDETDSDKCAALREYGYALRGRQAVSERLLVKGKRYSAIAGPHIGGMLDVNVAAESVDAGIFLNMLSIVSYCTYLLPYNGSNPSCAVKLDNANIHHIETGARMNINRG